MEKIYEIKEITNSEGNVTRFNAILTATEGDVVVSVSATTGEYRKINQKPLLDWPIYRIENIGKQLRRDNNLDAIVEQKISGDIQMHELTRILQRDWKKN
jgi:hypothetical protein